MARIPDEVVERLKHEVSVQRLAEAKGIELKRHGENLVGRCPFHDDRTPSLVITPSKNLWHCMGACQVGGTVIDFVMRVERCSFRLACEMLLKDAPSLAASLDADRPRTTTARLDEIAKPEEPDAVVLRRVVDFYHATLKESGDAASAAPHPCSSEPTCALPSVSASRASHRAEAALPRSGVVPGPSPLAPSSLAPSSLTRCHAVCISPLRGRQPARQRALVAPGGGS